MISINPIDYDKIGHCLCCYTKDIRIEELKEERDRALREIHHLRFLNQAGLRLKK